MDATVLCTKQSSVSQSTAWVASVLLVVGLVAGDPLVFATSIFLGYAALHFANQQL